MTESNNGTASPGLSFETYGEHTSVPVEIQEVLLETDEYIPFLNRVLSTLTLTVVNSAVPKSIAGKLKLVLPPGTSVKKFEVCRPDNKWYPATAVPKKKAQHVVYNEREKGRDVAAVSNTAANTFQIDVSPLPYQKEVQCRLELMIDGTPQDAKDLIHSFFPGEGTKLVVSPVAGFAPISDSITESQAGEAVVGNSFGRTHFCCKIPPLCRDNHAQHNPIKRLAVVWDNSASAQLIGDADETLLGQRLERLRELFEACNEKLQAGTGTNVAPTGLVVELWTFGTLEPMFCGSFQDIEEFSNAVLAIEYDGGSDTTPLAQLFSDFARRGSDKIVTSHRDNLDAVLVVSDASDNLGRVPELSDPFDIDFPIHCIADGNGADLKSAKQIAAFSPRFPGSVFTKKDVSYVTGVLTPLPVLRAIKTDQDEDAFLQENDEDDGFTCVPDYRLGKLNQTIGSEGLLITGTLNVEGQELCSVTTIVAEVVAGNQVHKYHFLLREGEQDSSDLSIKGTDTPEKVIVHKCRPVYVNMDDASRKGRVSSILGHVHAEQLYKAIDDDAFKSGLDLSYAKQELALRYGFCSPESSLLMLFDADQFLENNVLPAKSHPVWDEEAAAKSLAGLSTAQQNETEDKDSKPGQVGGLKLPTEQETVLRLFDRFHAYFAEAPKLPKKKEKIHARDRSQVSGTNLARADPNHRRAPPRATGHSRESILACSVARSYQYNVATEGSVREEPAAVPDALELFRSAPATSETTEYDDEDSLSPRRSANSESREERARAMADSLVWLRARPEPPQDADCDTFASLDVFPRPLARSAIVEEGDSLAEEEEEEEEGCDDSSGDAWYSGSPRSFVPTQDEAQPQSDQRVAPPSESMLYLEDISKCLKANDAEKRSWKERYSYHLREQGGHVAASPSFFINCARLLLEHGQVRDAVRVLTNCLESNIADIQMMRTVAYVLLSAEAAVDLSIAVFAKVLDLEPNEPQSFLDYALARFWKAWKALRSLEETDSETGAEVALRDLGKDLVDAQELVAHVLTHKWANRFEEIEWPALVLLHYMHDLIQGVNKRLDCPLPTWPGALNVFQKDSSDPNTQKPLFSDKFDPALMVWMGWDTDHTDIDLHIEEPSGTLVYYGNKEGSAGGLLSRDFTKGYGPEVYLLKEATHPGTTRKALGMVGSYKVHAKYYAGHQDSMLTGTTSVVVWKVEKNGGKQEFDFRYVRLDRNKQKEHVATACVQDDAIKKTKVNGKTGHWLSPRFRKRRAKGEVA